MSPLHLQLSNPTLSRVIKRLHFPLEVIQVCVRWYAAYPLSLRQLEEMMAERGVCVDHATVHRWALKMLPVLAAVLRQRKRPVGGSWHMDETYILVGGKRKYLSRAVDRLEQTGGGRKLGLPRGSSFIPTKTESEQLSSSSSWACESGPLSGSWDTRPRTH